MNTQSVIIHTLIAARTTGLAPSRSDALHTLRARNLRRASWHRCAPLTRGAGRGKADWLLPILLAICAHLLQKPLRRPAWDTLMEICCEFQLRITGVG